MAVMRCGFTWSDGWGEHECVVILSEENDKHEGKHSCLCDASTPQAEEKEEE